jgi:hypothetical protein
MAAMRDLAGMVDASSSGNGSANSASRPASPLEAPPTKSWLSNLRRPRTAPGPKAFGGARSPLSEDVRRDSALLPPASPAPTARTSASARRSKELTGPEARKSRDLTRVSSLPVIVVHGSQDHEDAGSQPSTEPQSERVDLFSGITTLIPTGGFEELSSPDKLQFSQRGSILLDGKRAAVFAGGTITTTKMKAQTMETPPKTPEKRSPPVVAPAPAPTPATVTAPVSTPPISQLRPRPPPESMRHSRLSTRVLSADDFELSQRVRSMYEFGNEKGIDHGLAGQTLLEEEDDDDDDVELLTPTSPASQTQSLRVERIRSSNHHDLLRSPSFNSRRESFIPRDRYELAGGIEDWEDVEGGEVDRYGFILPKAQPPESRGSSRSAATYDSPGIQRVSTALRDVSDSPRRKRTVRRSSSKVRTSIHAPNGTPTRKPSKRSLHPPGSMKSFRSNTSQFSITQSPLRFASNRLPHNKERRWMDEASDMLTLPPGLEDIAVAKEGGREALAMKKKEWQREGKWRKMGKATLRQAKGGGMLFDFDTKDPKVISRTWKGIPDKWRASAWWSFLDASAKKDQKSPGEEELIELFYEFQEEPSADDVQIDCDVPRTINRHIMFRRRYRGGQRLLFRVLHALSLYFPDTGYVQGMAALAATFLCYYDEEQAFIMMVRMWQLRGLDRLYSSGFGGLMEALDDFEKHWLRGGDVAQKLVSLASSNPEARKY